MINIVKLHTSDHNRRLRRVASAHDEISNKTYSLLPSPSLGCSVNAEQAEFLPLYLLDNAFHIRAYVISISGSEEKIDPMEKLLP